MEHNRLQLRVAKNLLAKVRVSFKEFFAYIQDLAKAGVGFSCNREIDLGTSVDMFLNVPGHKNMTLAGDIVWKRNLPTIAKNKFQYGMKLAEKSEEYDVYIEELIRNVYEKRKTPRFKAALEITSNDILDLMDAAIEDVSAGGLYVRTGCPLTLHGQYEIILISQDLENPINCVGEVVAAFECEPDDNFDHPYGAGVKIISFVGDDKARFSDYIKHLEALYNFHWPEELQKTEL